MRWLVRKSSIQQTSLTDDFVWTGWGVRFTPRYRPFSRLTRRTHYEPLVFVLLWFLKSTLQKKKPFRKGLHTVAISRRGNVVLQSSSWASFYLYQSRLPISTPNQPWVVLPEASRSACGDVDLPPNANMNRRCRANQSIAPANSKRAIRDFLPETIATQPLIIRNAFQ